VLLDLRVVDVCYVDGGCSWISVSTSEGAHHRHFLTLMVDAAESPTSAPPREPAIDVFYVDGGCSRISVSTSQGGRHRCFFMLIVGAPGSHQHLPGGRRFLALVVGIPGSSDLAPPREPTVDVFYVDGGCSRISASTQGPIIDVS
jgi:hypothetical protein